MKISIIDYIGNCDSKGNPNGHPIKVIKEFYGILEKVVNINVFVPSIYSKSIKDIKKIFFLKYAIDVTKSNMITKITNTIKKIINIWTSINNSNDDILWFINMDFVLFIALIFRKKKYQKIWVTTYIDGYKSKIKNYFFIKGISKVDLVITSNSRLTFNNNNIMYVPDYIYLPEFYGKYKTHHKKNQVLCIGTISNIKDIEGLVSVFNNLDTEVLIYGQFFDNNLYQRCKHNCSKNIEIYNSRIKDNDYYKLIAESRYVILPYKEEFYESRTSGVLLEALFLGSIPIAPKFLLEFSNIKGIAYNQLSDLFYIFSDENKLKDVEVSNIDFDDPNNFFNNESIRKKFIDFMYSKRR